MNLNLEDKIAFVGGSTQGIGRAAAEELALLGARVVLIARNEARLQNALDGLSRPKNQDHRYIVADYSNAQNVQDTVENFCRQEQLNAVHILINNTGGPSAGPMYEADPEALTQAYEQHLLCNHLLAQTMIPKMKRAGYGRIINVISTSVKEPIPGLGVSNTTRWAVASWAKTLAGEVASMGITVNNVLPGYIQTGRLEEIFGNIARQKNVSPEVVEEEMRLSVPAQRLGKPEELGAAIAFLASPAASYINGINLTVDGGRTRSL